MRVMRGASRYRGERRRSSITSTSSLSPAANDLTDRPQIIRLRSCPQFMARITQISHIHKIPVVPRHPRTNKRFFELELTSLLSALYAPISKHFIQTNRPILRRDSGQTMTPNVVMFRMGNPSFCLNQTASVETIPCLQTKGRGTQASLHTAPPPIDVDHCSNLDHKNTPYTYTRNSYTLLLRPLPA